MKQITYSKWNRMGRMGNMMFELAALKGMSLRSGRFLYLPAQWIYQEYFQEHIPIGEPIPFDGDVCEPAYHFTGWEYWDKALSGDLERVSVSGWLQSEKYWEGYEVEVKAMFTFKEGFYGTLREKYEHILGNGKETIAITVRVGQDYKDNGNYVILPITYYVRTLYEKFKYWNNGNYNVLIFSDDLEWCKLNFTAENMYFAQEDGASQLCLMTMCDHFILANSTFSWWGAYLGRKPHSKIVRPSEYFKGYLLPMCDTKDLWPEDWEVVEAQAPIDLRDVTFTIPVHYDHEDRKQNLGVAIAYLRKHFATSILVGEQGSRMFEQGEYDYIEFPYKEFHRTKMLNDMANEASTPIIVNYDADVLIPVLQTVEAVEAIRKRRAVMVYPYDGRFARVDRSYYPIIRDELDCGYFKRETLFKGTRPIDPPSVGGAIFWDKESFIYGGMENEHMINYGPEDVERMVRFEKLGYAIKRIPGTIYHLDHWVGKNSGGGGNLHFDNNHKELNRIEKMTNQEMLEELNKWEWVNTYLSGYYEDITDGSVNSAREVYRVLRDRYSFTPASIIDVGCGVGGWWKGFREEGYTGEYKGIDYKIPKHKLLLPKEDYQEYDLRKLYTTGRQYDLAICLEVGEHLPKECASILVHSLVSLGKTILFSAAIPHQGGTNHYNEQWQSYWAKLFANLDYHPITPYMSVYIRHDPNIELWYRNNAVIYRGHGAHNSVEDYVHPQLYTNVVGTLTDWK